MAYFAMAQVQIDAFQFGAFHCSAGPVWRIFSMAHSSTAQFWPVSLSAARVPRQEYSPTFFKTILQVTGCGYYAHTGQPFT